MKPVIIGAATEKIKAKWLAPAEGVRAAAKLWFEGDSVYAENDKGGRCYAPVDRVVFSSPMPGLPRRITFDNGIIIVVDDNDAIDAAIGKRGLLYRMEAHWRGIFAAAAAAVFVAFVFMAYALPMATTAIAANIPQDALESLSGDLHAQLQESDFLRASTLPAAEKTRMEKIFIKAVAGSGGNDDGFRFQLLFHRMPFNAANAFALPDGMVVATDKLAAILDDRELEAVFAHEISHIRRRHGLRLVMESSTVFVLLSFLLGDVSSVLSGGAALLVQQKYSRDFEREADCDTYRYLRGQGEGEEAMVAALTKLEAEYDNAQDAEEEEKQQGKDNKAGDADNDKAESGEETSTTKKAAQWAFALLSSHPATRERTDFVNFCYD